MAGIYIHIPFCKQACHYCNFHFSTSLQYKNEFIAALLKEFALRKDEWCTVQFETIYFGGGTPGILTVTEIESILKTIKENYDCTEVQELCLEMNPDDVTLDKMKGLKALGVNRISLGVQSFYEEDLKYMNRSHTAEKAVESISIIKEQFENYTVDLIYGYPLLTDEKLETNVSKLIELEVPHISIYGMTVEPNTALDHFIKKGQEKPLNTASGAKQFEYLMQRLEANGLEHYEISSYAKEGHRAIHNSNYWSGKSYIGFGPGAHSYKENIRAWNISNNALYIKSIENGELNQEEETLSVTDILNEFVLLGLRVKEGLHLKKYKALSSQEQFNTMLLKAEKHIAKGLLEKTDDVLKLTKKGRLYCDGISADFFVD